MSLRVTSLSLAIEMSVEGCNLYFGKSDRDILYFRFQPVPLSSRVTNKRAMVEIKAADDAPSVSDDPSSYKHDRRVVIYPSYINSKCSVAEGRRIPKDCACDAPNVLEIRDVLEKSMKLPCEVEDKSYPRDFWQRGRVRVTLKKDDGSPLAKEFPTRRAVMMEIARLVPKHPGRQPGAPKDKKTMPTPHEILTQFTSQPGQAGAGGSGGGAGGGGSSKKDKGGKKGKKGR
jgi:signal recognition particle subunit SRP19